MPYCIQIRKDYYMLKSILSPKTCADCKICCNYSPESLWDIPGFTLEEYQNIIKKFPKYEPKSYCKNNLYYFEMNQLNSKKYLCPFLGNCGCTLGDLKPFKCAIWPFYIVNHENQIYLALSNVCPNLDNIEFEKNPASLHSFIEKIKETIKKHPELIEMNRSHFQLLKQLTLTK